MISMLCDSRSLIKLSSCAVHCSFFHQTHFESFQRQASVNIVGSRGSRPAHKQYLTRNVSRSSNSPQINLYSFRRVTQGTDKGGYYHECFLRWRPRLAESIKRVKFKGRGPRKPDNPDSQPNFSLIPPVCPPPNRIQETTNSSQSTSQGNNDQSGNSQGNHEGNHDQSFNPQGGNGQSGNVSNLASLGGARSFLVTAANNRQTSRTPNSLAQIQGPPNPMTTQTQGTAGVHVPYHSVAAFQSNNRIGTPSFSTFGASLLDAPATGDPKGQSLTHAHRRN